MSYVDQPAEKRNEFKIERLASDYSTRQNTYNIFIFVTL